MMLQVGVIEIFLSFHQADHAEIQVINKNIKRLNRRTIYRAFIAINDNKRIQRRPKSERNNCISKSTFKIIKKYQEIDNCLSISELSNKIFDEKRVKISSETIRRYLVSQHYNCMKKPKFKQYILAIYKKKKFIDFEKNHLDLEPAYLVFVDEVTFLWRCN